MAYDGLSVVVNPSNTWVDYLTVADPYRWLEDVDAPDTRAWVEAQNRLSLPLLAQLPEREPIRKRLTELWNYERYGLVQKVAGRYF